MPVDGAIVVPTTDDRAPQPKFVALAIAFAIAVAVIGYIVYQIIKLLDKVIPPPDKKPDPPPQSPTNSPPVTINPSGGPMPAVRDFHTKTLSTNASWGAVPYYDISGCFYDVQCEKFQAKQYYDGYWSTGMTCSTNTVDWEDTHYRIDCYVCNSAHSVFYEYYHYGTNFYNAYFTADYIASNHVAPAYFNLTDRPKQEVQFFRLAPRSL